MGYKKCPICGEKITAGKSNMIAHIDTYHADDIPSDKSAGEYLYLYEHNGKGRKCMMCPKPTQWNKATDKYNAFCSDNCKGKYVEMINARMKKVYGKEKLTDDPDWQKKMLAGRSISGVYRHSDGGKWNYTGSYEQDFCQMNDLFLGMPSEDILMPSPNVYHYMYKGQKKFYMPDAFIPSIGVEIEIKDGGSNPNMHHKIQDVDKVKESLKDAVMEKQKDYHYIKIVNKNYGDYFKLLEKIRNDNLTTMEAARKIKLIPKGSQETVLEDIQWKINCTESYLTSVCEEYGIDYDKTTADPDVFFVSESLYVTEGVLKELWQGAKELVKKIIQALIYMWKRAVELVKFMLNKLIGLFSGKPSNVNFSSGIELKLVTLEGARMTKENAKSFDDLKKIATEALNSISDEIRERSQTQIEITKRIEMDSNKEERLVKEAVVSGREVVQHNDDFKEKQLELGVYDPNGDDIKYSMTGSDVMSNKQKFDIGKFDKEKHQAMLKSEDIVGEYNRYIDFKLNEIIRNGSSAGDGGLDSMISSMYRMTVEQMGCKEEEVRRYIKSTFFDISDDPAVIKRLLHLRLNYNKKIVSILENMVRINYRVLGIADTEANAWISKIKSGQSGASQVANDIEQKIIENKDKFFTRPGMIDFRSLNAGVIFYTKEDIGELKPVFQASPKKFFNLAMRYDCICLGHGGVASNAPKEELDKANEVHRQKEAYENELKSKYGTDMSKIQPDEIKKYSELDSEYNRLEKALAENGRWYVQPIATEHHPATSDVNELVHNCIAEGHRRILLLSCNPGHKKLDQDIRDNKKVLVHMATNTLLVD